MITLKTHTKEEFEAELAIRCKKMRSPANKKLLSILYENAINGVEIEATELAKLINATSGCIHKKISNLNTLHGVRILNSTGKIHKSSYKLVGFFTPRKRNRKKVSKAPEITFQASVNDKLINQVFC